MTVMKYLLLLTTFILLCIIISCNGEKMEEQKVHYNSLKEVSASAWEKLAQKKIYFGHQSVGNNIIDGVMDLMRENPQIRLNIVKTSDPDELKTGLFAHSSLGKNDDPQSKIDAFANLIKNGIGSKVNIAFFKFCFADIVGTTDVESVFDIYKNTLSDLKKAFPKTKFVHVTVPLVITKKSLKARFNRLIGKEDIWFYDGNIKRNELNKLIINEYRGKEPIFDLASIESTYPDGRKEIFKDKGNIYYAMVPAYTKDAGHLNELGRKQAAEQLLLLLAGLD